MELQGCEGAYQPISCHQHLGWPGLPRSPERPKERIVKRLIGIEGDWLLAEGHSDIIRVPEVRTTLVKLPKDRV